MSPHCQLQLVTFHIGSNKKMKRASSFIHTNGSLPPAPDPEKGKINCSSASLRFHRGAPRPLRRRGKHPHPLPPNHEPLPSTFNAGPITCAPPR
jgi:hypothetical protein